MVRALLIRICHLITGLDTGGAERSLVNLVTAMDRSEFNNEVVTLLKPGPMADALTQAGIPVISMGMRRHGPNPAILLSLVRYLRTKKPMILQTWLYHADLFGTAAAIFASLDHLLWNVRCSEIDQPGMRRSTRLLPRFLAMLSRRPNAIIVNSQRGQRHHDQIGYRPKQWINIPNGVDLERFFPRPSERPILRGRVGLPADSPVIGFVARYHPMKDVESFLRAAALFRRGRETAKFILCGDGLTPGNAKLAALIEVLGLNDCVVLLGRRTDVELIYPALDVLTLCSIYGEGFPNVLCEAMACNVPCVATDVGDSAEIIGDCGLIVPPRDPKALAHAWQTLIENGQRLAPLGGRSRVAARYGLKRMCSHYETLYRSLAINGQ